jgi:hypothetical protein
VAVAAFGQVARPDAPGAAQHKAASSLVGTVANLAGKPVAAATAWAFGYAAGKDLPLEAATNGNPISSLPKSNRMTRRGRRESGL